MTAGNRKNPYRLAAQTAKTDSNTMAFVVALMIFVIVAIMLGMGINNAPAPAPGPIKQTQVVR